MDYTGCKLNAEEGERKEEGGIVVKKSKEGTLLQQFIMVCVWRRGVWADRESLAFSTHFVHLCLSRSMLVYL